MHALMPNKSDSALWSHILMTAQSFLSCLFFTVSVSKPTVTTGSGYGFTVPQGMRISLQCQARGSPPISYIWYKEQTNNQEPIKVATLSTLLFKPAMVADSGSYFCTAKGRVGSEQHSDIVKFVVKGEWPSFLVSILTDQFEPKTPQNVPLCKRRIGRTGSQAGNGCTIPNKKKMGLGTTGIETLPVMP